MYFCGRHFFLKSKNSKLGQVEKVLNRGIDGALRIGDFDDKM